MKKIELLSPAGDLERLKVTLLYGADAVYIGGEKYSLRANATNFSIENIKKGLDINNIQDRIKFTKGFSEVMKDVESNVEVDAYIKKYSGIMQVNEAALYAELNRLRNENKNGNNKHNILDNSKNTHEFKKGEITAEIYLLNICIYYFKKAENIFEFVEPADFSEELHIRLAEIIRKSVKEKKSITAGEIIGFFDKDDEKSKVAGIFSQKLPEIDVDSLMESSLEKVKQSRSSRKIQEMIEKMNEMYQAGKKEEANKIFVEIKEMQKKKR